MSKTKAFSIAALFSAFLGWFSLSCASNHSRIDGEQAKALVAKGAKLVDVRTPEEYATQHLPTAVNIPVQQLSLRITELEPKDQPLVLYCRSGHRSGLAFDQLKNAGFTQLYDLGPISAW